MSELEVSGERMIEDAYLQSLDAYVIYIMHTAAYAFAAPFCAGKDVLDLGCGSGYGANRIGQVASRVHGVDVDPHAVAFAERRYSRENVVFSTIQPDASLPFADSTFDVVLSFQVIEHVRNDERYLAQAHRVLRAGGMLIIVTPDRRNRLLPAQRPWNRWHVREYSAARLERVAATCFRIESSLKMGAEWPVAGVEIRRYRRTKWLTLPLTLPFVPDVLRRKGLDVLHRLRAKPPKIVAGGSVPSREFHFDEAAMRIEPDPPNSLNLVVVCRKGDGAP